MNNWIKIERLNSKNLSLGKFTVIGFNSDIFQILNKQLNGFINCYEYSSIIFKFSNDIQVCVTKNTNCSNDILIIYKHAYIKDVVCNYELYDYIQYHLTMYNL